MKILRKREVISRVGFSDMHLSRLEARNEFPKRFKLREDGSAVGWLEAEIDAWIEARAASRDAPPAPDAEQEPAAPRRRGRPAKAAAAA